MKIAEFVTPNIWIVTKIKEMATEINEYIRSYAFAQLPRIIHNGATVASCSHYDRGSFVLFLASLHGTPFQDVEIQNPDPMIRTLDGFVVSFSWKGRYRMNADKTVAKLEFFTYVNMADW